MPPVAARTIGGPGAGKTTRQTDIMGKCLETVVADPFQIGFVSFTRAARQAASQKAAQKFNVQASELEKHGWFRTLHSVAYRSLKVAEGELVLGTAADNEWLRDATGDEKFSMSGRGADEDYIANGISHSRAGKALALWDAARNRLCPLRVVWEYADLVDRRTPDLDDCEDYVTLYEDAKRRAGRLDFCDLLMRFAGKRFTGDHARPFGDCEPDGDFPILPVYFHDEMQDCSKLTALVFQRLTRHSQFVYLAGDDRQSIYSFCGSDGRILASWPVAKEECLPVSHRCSARILQMADKLIERVYPHRPFAPAREGGEVKQDYLDHALSSIKAGEDTLVLARTNNLARQVGELLDEKMIPWTSLKGGASGNAPARAAGVQAILALQKGDPIDGTAWWRLTQLLNSKKSEEALLVRGTKKRLEDEEQRRNMAADLRMLDLLGATEALKLRITDGSIAKALEPAAARLLETGRRHGIAALEKPTCRLGTCHGSKGMEATHVVAVNEIPYPTQKGIEEPEGLEEEIRLWYVTLTRARERLTIASTDGEPFPYL